MFYAFNSFSAFPIYYIRFFSDARLDIKSELFEDDWLAITLNFQTLHEVVIE